MKLKKHHLVLILDIVLIACFLFVSLRNKGEFNFVFILGIVLAILVMVQLIIYLGKSGRDKQSGTKASGRLYFKRRRFYGKIWRFIFKIEVGAEMLEFYVPPDLYDSVNEGDKVIFEYTSSFGGMRWINWIESYK